MDKWWELPKEHYNWESPITKIYGNIHNEIVRQDEENCTFAIEQAIGYKVDKDELIKALQYDREQYNKGYKDGVRETFIAELEKLKAEVCEPNEMEYFENSNIWQNWFCNLIDNHIKELKGEQNDMG